MSDKGQKMLEEMADRELQVLVDHMAATAARVREQHEAYLDVLLREARLVAENAFRAGKAVGKRQGLSEFAVVSAERLVGTGRDPKHRGRGSRLDKAI